MTHQLWTAVDRYINDRLVPSDDVLDAVLQASAAAGLPSIHVTPNQGKLLMLLAQLQGARNILEIGTLGGYSTIWLARGLSAAGRLITLEIDARFAKIAQSNFARAAVSQLIDLRIGRALDVLPQLQAEGCAPFDFIFIDADKANTADYFQWAIKLSHPGSLIIVDNIVRSGAVIDETSSDENVQGVRRFYELLAAEPRVTATAIQTVGSKGHDGFAIAVVNPE
jgi:predicted O-methyltransferase YrrM